ncbi:unnamed protein product, partial [Prorocentrum cordatum]
AQGALGALERRLLCRLEASERRFEAQRSAEGARQRAWRDGIAQRLAAVEQRLESVRGVGPLVEQVARVMPDVQRLQDSCDRVLADRAAFDSWQRRLAACEGAARRASDADRRVDELWALVEQTAGEQGRVLSECVGEVELGMSRLCAVEGLRREARPRLAGRLGPPPAARPARRRRPAGGPPPAAAGGGRPAPARVRAHAPAPAAPLRRPRGQAPRRRR